MPEAEIRIQYDTFGSPYQAHPNTERFKPCLRPGVAYSMTLSALHTELILAHRTRRLNRLKPCLRPDFAYSIQCAARKSATALQFSCRTIPPVIVVHLGQVGVPPPPSLLNSACCGKYFLEVVYETWHSFLWNSELKSVPQQEIN